LKAETLNYIQLPELNCFMHFSSYSFHFPVSSFEFLRAMKNPVVVFWVVTRYPTSQHSVTTKKTMNWILSHLFPHYRQHSGLYEVSQVETTSINNQPNNHSKLYEAALW